MVGKRCGNACRWAAWKHTIFPDKNSSPYHSVSSSVARVSRGYRLRETSMMFCLSIRQNEGEGCPALICFCPNSSLVTANHHPADGQPQAAAGPVLGARVGNILLKNVVQTIGGNSRARVLDIDPITVGQPDIVSPPLTRGASRNQESPLPEIRIAANFDATSAIGRGNGNASPSARNLSRVLKPSWARAGYMLTACLS